MMLKLDGVLYSLGLTAIDTYEIFLAMVCDGPLAYASASAWLVVVSFVVLHFNLQDCLTRRCSLAEVMSSPCRTHIL